MMFFWEEGTVWWPTSLVLRKACPRRSNRSARLYRSFPMSASTQQMLWSCQVLIVSLITELIYLNQGAQQYFNPALLP
jgi:hypothetical protein